MRRRPAVVTAVAVLALGSLALAAPASATVTAGQYLIIDETVGGVLSLNPSTGAAATLGPGSTMPGASGLVVGATGVGIAIQQNPAEVWAVDLAGASPVLASLTAIQTGGAPHADCVGLARLGSDYLVVCEVGTSPTVGRLDGATYEFTSLGAWTPADPPVTVASSPSGALFAMTAAGALYSMTVSGGSVSIALVGSSPDITGVSALAFQGAQAVAIATVVATGDRSLVLIDTANGQAFGGPALVPSSLTTSAFAIVPSALGSPGPAPADPALAATGGGVELLAGAALLLALGLGLTAGQARRRRTARR